MAVSTVVVNGVAFPFCMQFCTKLVWKVNCYQEVLVLLWKLMEENPVFTQYVLKHCDVNEVSI